MIVGKKNHQIAISRQQLSKTSARGTVAGCKKRSVDSAYELQSEGIYSRLYSNNRRDHVSAVRGP